MKVHSFQDPAWICSRNSIAIVKNSQGNQLALMMCKLMLMSHPWFFWRTQLFVDMFSVFLEEKDSSRWPSVFHLQGYVYTQSQTRQAWLTTEVGIEARLIPHISVVPLPSGKLQDQIGKSVPSLGAKFGVNQGWFIRLWVESTWYVLFWPSLAWSFWLLWRKMY